MQEATYRRGTPFAASMRQQVEILRGAEPDAVICIGAYAACAAFIRDAREAGWDVPIANISFVGSESLLTLLLEAGKKRGSDLTPKLIFSQVVPSYSRTELAAVREYRELMDGFSGMPTPSNSETGYRAPRYSDVSLEGFLNAKLLHEILKKLGTDVSRNRLRSVVEALGEVELGIDVPARFERDRHQGLDRVYYATIDDGRWTQVEDLRRWKK